MEPVEPFFLNDTGLKLLMFGGKGGVGKTTCATAAALRLAGLAAERKILLVSTDPAHSIADCLAGYTPQANLQVLELDAQAYLEAFREKNSVMLREIIATGVFFDDRDIEQFLNLSLPGLDELMAFLQIGAWVEANEYDCIVVDTAPTGHTLRLLAMPELIGKWLDMLEVLLGKRRYLRSVFGGSDQHDPLDEFVAVWRRSLAGMEHLLQDEQLAQFVPVTLAEPLCMQETVALARELAKRTIAAPTFLVNRLHLFGDCPDCSAAADEEQLQILDLFANCPTLQWGWGVELFCEEVRGARSLTRFWTNVRQLSRLPQPLRPPSPPFTPAVENPFPLPSPQARLLLFAGKGGVGKTTLACATALRLAQAFPQKRILLFSTDPAHSLSACLHRTIGPARRCIAASVDAVEIDAEEEFSRLKARYAADVQTLLESVVRGFDLAFDGEVLERMMDLAPPGLDEIMALTQIMQLMADNRYDLFVLDCAPTGHLIRLLELPNIANQWLKAFFNLLLKYKTILKLPSFSSQLVEISKELKRLRTTLLNPALAQLYAVTIPTEMALNETSDLIAACERIGIAVPVFFLNLMTPHNPCSRCTAVREREQVVAQKLAAAYRGKWIVRIERGRGVLGLDRVGEFGARLYEPAQKERNALVAS